MSWEKVKLGDICESISDGDHLPPPKSVDGIPFVTISNVNSSNQFDFKNTMFVPQEYYEKLDEKRKPRINDILYSVVGSFGIPVFIKENRPFVFQRHIAILRPNESRIHPRYLYYKMLSKDFYMKADAVAIGAAQRTISLTSLRNMEISIPCKDSQKRIADILSAYDNLIENNQKQIKLLEEAAQRLYKQWFIDLRYPGHETTPIIDGLPEGWKKEKLVEIIDYEIGGGWGEDDIKEKCDQPAFVIRGTDFYGITHGEILNIPFRYHSKTNLDARALCDGDIIFEVSGGSKTEGVAKTVLIKQALLDHLKYPVMCASFCKLIRLKNRKLSQYMYDAFFYLRKSGKTAEYDKRSASSIVNYRWKDFLNEVDILIPPNNIVEMYNGIASSAYERIINFSLSIETAKKTRDRLLPKLMNGEL